MLKNAVTLLMIQSYLTHVAHKFARINTATMEGMKLT